MAKLYRKEKEGVGGGEVRGEPEAFKNITLH